MLLRVATFAFVFVASSLYVKDRLRVIQRYTRYWQCSIGCSFHDKLIFVIAYCFLNEKRRL